ncbi:HD domain-containing protein [Arenibaculum sp.]|jgi:putative hydrolase of HD superfamily|uniref:HD domain-containing protein n=1 Tax=Arenibaculum sp. TaxID=2865862 RepID=UPI002E0F3E6E|nr:HD domain-containing protein [Arenibaculum sp.]
MKIETSADGDRLTRILDFLLLIDRFKTVERRGYVGSDGARRETDAEHTWHMAMFALLLHGELGFEADIGHTLCLVLVHDLVEIHAGDTYAYDDAGRAGQEERELIAARRLFGTLPSDLGNRLHEWWREFEEGATPEARLAKAVDRLQGFAQNFLSGGRAWRENGIARERTRQRTDLPRALDPALAWVVDEIYARADRAGLWPLTESGRDPVK